jgi:polysaccharide transporter, PST family
VQSLSGSVNRLVLGAVAPVAVLGEYAGAEKITRVFQQGMWPVNQALYPKLTQQTQNNPSGALKTVRLSLFFLGGVGAFFGVAIFLGAPLLVHLALGPAFREAVPVLRVFSLWIPLIALTTVIIFQLLLPNHLDNQFNLVNVTAGLLGIGAALLLAPRLGAIGIAWAAVGAQTYTLAAFSVILWRAGLNPFVPVATVHPPRSANFVPSLASAGGNQQMKLRLREKLADAEARVAQPVAIAIPTPKPQQGIARDRR